MSVNIKGVIKGSALSLIITFILIFALAVIAYFTKINEKAVTIGAYAAVIIGVFAGSAAVAASAPEKKFLHCLLVCAVYTLALIAVSMILNGRVVFNLHMAAVAGGIFFAAFLGMIIGRR